MFTSAFSRAAAFSTFSVVAGLLTLPPTSSVAADSEPPIDRAARANGMTAAEVRDELRSDRSLRVTRTGRFYYVEPGQAQAAAAAPPRAPQAAAPLVDAFDLHSNETSTKKIYLDFDGANVSNTEWNTASALPSGDYPGWSTDGSATFSDAERAVVHEVWQRVTEDYAPFGVDVTTEDPGPEALLRRNEADQAYGVRVLFSDSTVARDKLCGVGIECGGVAFGGISGPTFDLPTGETDRYEPSWVFPQSLGPDDPASMAESASHEVGHNLGLSHDGIGEEEYFVTNSLWGPIMGAPYGSAVTQWSQGSYPDADNHEGDVDIIAAVLGVRADEAQGDVAGAAAFGDGHGVIASQRDADTYRLGDCTGSITLTATPAVAGANLDIKLELLGAAGNVIASNNPAAARVDWGVASGLGARITATLGTGADFVRISGAGVGTWATTDQYDRYGSLGEYQISRTGGSCSTVAGDLPSAPTAVAATRHATLPQVTVHWQPPSDAGTSPITGYEVSVDGGEAVAVGPEVRSRAFSGLAAGTTYTFRVVAVTAVGSGPSASAQATTSARAPSVPRNVTATPHASRPAVTVRWAAPADPGSSAITGYRLAVNGAVVADEHTLTAGVTQLPVSGAYATTYTFSLRAVGAGGVSPAVTRTATTVKGATVTALTVPKKVRKGKRPVIKVAVRTIGASGAVPGRVRLTVGKKTVVLSVRNGVASYKAPKQKKVGKVKVAAAYLGAAAFKPSSARKAFKVGR